MNESFDLSELPTEGTTILEASAGTGKTWTIAALVTRYVADGVADLDQLLVVTFGRAASQELRERVRGQLVAAERDLAGWLARTDPGRPDRPDGPADPDDPGSPASPGSPDALTSLLRAGDRSAVVARRVRLRQAVAGFDAATIATTHQFCQLVLRSLGIAGDTDPDATLVDDLDDLLREVVDDLYLAQWQHAEEHPPLTRSTALQLARDATRDALAELEPADLIAADEGPVVARVRVRFAQAVREELAARKSRGGLLSYDDLLSGLAEALRQEPARMRMRRRWKVVLVDEFQDTDPTQWKVLDRAFSSHAAMVLIGDPKQAIYAFRGGDVTTYLTAAATAGRRRTLSVNWRSDQALVDQVQKLLAGAALGDDAIRVLEVSAHHRGSRLCDAGAPFRLRRVTRADLGVGPRRNPPVRRIREYISEDLARDIKRLLDSSATYEGRPVAPGDIAVLAHRHADLHAVQQQLARVGVPAVVSGSASVFATPSAREWLVLLEALEQPHRAERVRAAALTPFVGTTAADLDQDPDQSRTDALAEHLRGWADLLARRGVAAVYEAAVRDGLLARVLGTVGGARALTDLRHLAQSLHRYASDERIGVVGLVGWLREQMAEEKIDVSADRVRRLDSDAAAVQLVTIHASKGLEYPIIYLPNLWDRYVKEPEVPRFHRPADGTDQPRRCLDVGGPTSPTWEASQRYAAQEEAGETLRLLYVALTRARSQVVAWWAPSAKNTESSALHRMLFGRRPGDAVVPDFSPVREEDETDRILQIWAAEGGPQVEPAQHAEVDATPVGARSEELRARRFTRTLDQTWRRTSYSALTRVDPPATAVPAVAMAPTSEPDLAGDPDRWADAESIDIPEQPEQPEQSGPGGQSGQPGQSGPGEPGGPGEIGDSDDPLSPMADLPQGAAFGSLVHAVLEHVDLRRVSDDELPQAVREEIDVQARWWPVAADREVLADALVQVYSTPLGPLAEGRTLAELDRGGAFHELDFEFPLAGGDHAAAQAPRLADLAPLLRTHLPEGDPVRAWADQLDDPEQGVTELGDQELRGYLTGSIDVVLRTPAGRFLVVDHKTNRLGDPSRPLRVRDYDRAALDEAMGHSSYPLQALLYAVVLHRYLRWRLPDYDPTQHLGGVLYLYLRGMAGPQTPAVDGHPCGVFSWRPPVALVEALSALLAGGAR